MKSGRFRYTVTIELELTGLDLCILEYHARQHYDAKCRCFFAPESEDIPVSRESIEGAYWLQEWQWQDWQSRFGHLEKKLSYEEYRHPSENPEFAVKVDVTQRTLDRCLKILERLGFEELRALTTDLFGDEESNGDHQMAARVAELRESLLEAARKVREEWQRLDVAAETGTEET